MRFSPTTLLLPIPPADTPPKRFTTSHLLSHPTTVDAQTLLQKWRENTSVTETPTATGTFSTARRKHPWVATATWDFTFLFQKLFPQRSGRVPLHHKGRSRVDTIPSEAHPRAILEPQFLSIKSRIAATQLAPAECSSLEGPLPTGPSDSSWQISSVCVSMSQSPRRLLARAVPCSVEAAEWGFGYV
ncbi:hypothetical protein OG21DRAFT_772061 [Imleria badia]|nr:hypothetical protein OG21DRAFT_772061 [Imleria badia]